MVRKARGPYRRLQKVAGGAAVAGARYRLDAPGVALTFDDGPHPDYTHAVLDVLATAEVQATFFVVGKNVRSHPQVIRRIVDEGHAVASHSMTHTDPWELKPQQLWRDYRAGHLELADLLGNDIRLFRPPKGHLDWWGALAVRRLGLEPYLWTLDAADWEPDLEADDVVQRLGDPAPGDIILLHDAIEGPLAPKALDRSAMIAGLTQFLMRARANDVQFRILP